MQKTTVLQARVQILGLRLNYADLGVFANTNENAESCGPMMPLLQ